MTFIKRRPRIVRGEQEWQQIIQDQAQSGQSQQTYCKAHGIAYGSFVHWRSKVRPTLSKSKSSPFVEIPITPAAEGKWDIKIQLGGSVTMRLRRV